MTIVNHLSRYVYAYKCNLINVGPIYEKSRKNVQIRWIIVYLGACVCLCFLLPQSELCLCNCVNIQDLTHYILIVIHAE
jgi:hypothetical protein